MTTSSRPADYHPTIAVDFDGVLYPYTGPFSHELAEAPIEGAVEWFRSLHPEFGRVVFSCRALELPGVAAIQQWLFNHGFLTTDSGYAYVPVTSMKPHADLYVDDKGFQFRGPGTYPSLEYIRSFRSWLPAHDEA